MGRFWNQLCNRGPKWVAFTFPLGIMVAYTIFSIGFCVGLLWGVTP